MSGCLIEVVISTDLTVLYDNLDILLISETKTDSSFPHSHYMGMPTMESCFSLLLYISEKTNRPHYMSLEGCYVEIYMRKKNGLLVHKIQTKT